MRLHQVSFGYPGQAPILERFSLELPDRGITCLFGPSGCGKTTLLRLLAGLERPWAGEIRNPPRRVARVFQENRLLPWATALENITAVLNGKNASDTAAYWLEQVGLGDALDKRPDQLSGGMRRRVAIARPWRSQGIY